MIGLLHSFLEVWGSFSVHAVKRVLFLADRIALVNQAVNAFKKHLPESSPVNLVTEKDTEGRVFVSTYPTMMGLIDETKGGQRCFGVGILISSSLMKRIARFTRNTASSLIPSIPCWWV